jgi:hypothetical protein
MTQFKNPWTGDCPDCHQPWSAHQRVIRGDGGELVEQWLTHWPRNEGLEKWVASHRENNPKEAKS